MSKNVCEPTRPFALSLSLPRCVYFLNEGNLRRTAVGPPAHVRQMPTPTRKSGKTARSEKNSARKKNVAFDAKLPNDRPSMKRIAAKNACVCLTKLATGAGAGSGRCRPHIRRLPNHLRNRYVDLSRTWRESSARSAFAEPVQRAPSFRMNEHPRSSRINVPPLHPTRTENGPFRWGEYKSLESL